MIEPNGLHEDVGDCPEVEERIPEGWGSVDGGHAEDCECEDCLWQASEEYDAELAQDMMLAQQELEDFEQADEYFNHYDYGMDGGDW